MNFFIAIADARFQLWLQSRSVDFGVYHDSVGRVCNYKGCYRACIGVLKVCKMHVGVGNFEKCGRNKADRFIRVGSLAQHLK